MKQAFVCDICTKTVKSGELNRIDIDQQHTENSFIGVHYEELVCNSCVKRIRVKIASMRKER